MMGLDSYTVLGSIVFYQELLKKEEGFSLLSFLSDLKYKTCTVPSIMNCLLLHSKTRQFIMLGTVERQSLIRFLEGVVGLRINLE